MTRFATLLLASIAVTACAPLSQAGLVYASRGQAGLTLAGGTPETPGFDLNIGMKISDFAYIPVAVGRPCEFSNRANCSQELQVIQAYNDVAGSTNDNTGAGAGRDNAGTQPPANAGGKSLSAQASPAPAAEQAIETAQRAEARAETAEQTTARLEKIIQTSNNRHDAMSVYGTFDTNGSAAPGASANGSLRLGRVFSTGLASQYLAEGVRDAQRLTALNQCITQANAAPDATLKAQLLAACASAAVRPTQP